MNQWESTGLHSCSGLLFDGRNGRTRTIVYSTFYYTMPYIKIQFAHDVLHKAHGIVFISSGMIYPICCFLISILMYVDALQPISFQATTWLKVALSNCLFAGI